MSNETTVDQKRSAAKYIEQLTMLCYKSIQHVQPAKKSYVSHELFKELTTEQLVEVVQLINPKFNRLGLYVMPSLIWLEGELTRVLTVRSSKEFNFFLKACEMYEEITTGNDGKALTLPLKISANHFRTISDLDCIGIFQELKFRLKPLTVEYDRCGEIGFIIITEGDCKITNTTGYGSTSKDDGPLGRKSSMEIQTLITNLIRECKHSIEAGKRLYSLTFKTLDSSELKEISNSISKAIVWTGYKVVPTLEVKDNVVTRALVVRKLDTFNAFEAACPLVEKIVNGLKANTLELPLEVTASELEVEDASDFYDVYQELRHELNPLVVELTIIGDTPRILITPQPHSSVAVKTSDRIVINTAETTVDASERDLEETNPNVPPKQWKPSDGFMESHDMHDTPIEEVEGVMRRTLVLDLPEETVALQVKSLKSDRITFINSINEIIDELDYYLLGGDKPKHMETSPRLTEVYPEGSRKDYLVFHFDKLSLKQREVLMYRLQSKGWEGSLREHDSHVMNLTLAL